MKQFQSRFEGKKDYVRLRPNNYYTGMTELERKTRTLDTIATKESSFTSIDSSKKSFKQKLNTIVTATAEFMSI
jgi:hypothetical protein